MRPAGFFELQVFSKGIVTPPGKIIFLHGASSSGKSTLARQLQASIDAPFWHISIDHLRDSGILPMDRFRCGDFSWRAARDAFFLGYHRSLVGYASAGNNLILEHILERPHWFDDLVTLFAPFDVYFVALHCPREELERREAARGDRPIGTAAEDFQRIHRGRSYDLELEALDGSVANGAKLLSAWRSRDPAATVFAKARAGALSGLTPTGESA